MNLCILLSEIALRAKPSSRSELFEEMNGCPMWPRRGIGILSLLVIVMNYTKAICTVLAKNNMYPGLARSGFGP